MKDDVFRFDDFLKDKNESKLEAKDIRKIFEDVEDDTPTYKSDFTNIEDDSLPKDNSKDDFSLSKDDMEELMSAHEDDDFIEEKEIDLKDDKSPEIEEDEVEEDEDDEIEQEIQIVESTENYYKLYSDKSEDFICDISVEGANPKETEARIVIESEDWTLMFNGELKNGKCVVPIKKLNILKEGQVGNIRLEVIAEGNLFVPWEDKFKVKLSKKVTVKVNEQKESPKKVIKKGVDVKVKVKK